jgi:hypothetical protein
MKSEKEIEDKFNELWKELNTSDSFYFDGMINGYLSALDWVMDEKLIKKKRNEVIK